MKNLNLICNAHLDPVWLWDWEEGIAAVLSTFRMAAKFCREYDDFIFNHNEALLYQWIELYEPELFTEIQELVKEGKWHIMGGWFLQPDCNMPQGESFIRQIETGRRYFNKNFGARPTTAINFDPFGHSRGLVQILKKSGYDSYLFCRPSEKDCPLESNDFIWQGFDNSRILAHRSGEGYHSLLGEATKKIREWEEHAVDGETGILLWGVGNHGGGPSYLDLNSIAQMQKEETDINLIHTVPEQFFSTLKNRTLNTVEKDLNPWAVGCYTSQIRVKQKHRELESELYLTEKMLSQAILSGHSSVYPYQVLEEAQNALLMAEFHDILPGTSIPTVEESGIRMMDYGLELLAREKRKAFFALAKGQEPAAEDTYPILVYNPHPFPIKGTFACEFQLKNQNWGTEYANPVVYEGINKLPTQVEKEACNMNLDWRKKVIFEGTLKPTSMNRFDCKVEWLTKKPDITEKQTGSYFIVENEDMVLSIDTKTGWLHSLITKGGEGKEWLKSEGGALWVMESDADPWGMRRNSYQDCQGMFTLLKQKEDERYAGTKITKNAVRIIENGEVRTVVEAVFGYCNSRACIRYILPQKGTELGVEIKVNWIETGKMLKFVLPTTLEEGIAKGETAFGVQQYEKDRTECVGQRWMGLFDERIGKAFTCINNGTYGADFYKGTIGISLIHSAAYSAHPIEERPLLSENRCIAYMDQGERNFSFSMKVGECKERRENIQQEAIQFHEKPVIVSHFPSGGSKKAENLCKCSDEAVVLVSMRMQNDNHTYLLRFFESTGSVRKTDVSFESLGIQKTFTFDGYEVKTILLDTKNKTLSETEMIQI